MRFLFVLLAACASVSNQAVAPMPAAAPRSGFAQITAGSYHACALGFDGHVECWGRNNQGQCNAPDKRFKHIAAAQWQTCGILLDDSVLCWGTTPGDHPPPVVSTKMKTLDGSGGAFCGLDLSSKAHCFGDFRYGELPTDPIQAISTNQACVLRKDGTGQCYDHRVQVPKDVRFKHITRAKYFGCGITSTDDVVCFGNVVAPAVKLKSITAGESHMCGITLDDTGICWSEAATTFSPSDQGEKRVPAGKLRSITAGDQFSCALDAKDEPICWGKNDFGQATRPPLGYKDVRLGHQRACAIKTSGDVVCWSRYKEPPAPPGPFEQLTVEHERTCGLKSDGTLVCWGKRPAPPGLEGKKFEAMSNGNEQLCLRPVGGQFTCYRYDEAIKEPIPPGVLSLSGSTQWCGLTADGHVFCRKDANEIGERLPPVDEVFRSYSAGSNMSCGIRPNGTLTCWSRNPKPIVTPEGTFTQVSTTCTHGCAIRTNGSLACWGHERNLGSPPGEFVKVSAGNDFSCAVRKDSALVCWGEDGLPLAP